MPVRFVLHHHPRSRAQRIKWLLEETGAPYEVVLHDLQAGSHKLPDFLKLNPDGKLPTLIDRGPDGAAEVAVTGSGLAPAPGSIERGPYLQWICYAAAAIEPALSDAVFPRAAPPPPTAIGWPPFEKALDRVRAALEPGPWLLGEKFSAADVMIGALLGWISSWGKLPEPERFAAYLGRIAERPAHARAYDPAA